MNEKLKQRCNIFITELGVPVTVFCKHVGISARAYYFWKKDELGFAESTLQRIDEYLKKYNF